MKERNIFYVMNRDNTAALLVLTVKLRSNGAEVLAKLYKGEPSAVTYSNRTQANAKALELGPGWHVSQFSSRPFYVVKG